MELAMWKYIIYTITTVGFLIPFTDECIDTNIKQRLLKRVKMGRFCEPLLWMSGLVRPNF
jgi:hypothetical protein